MVTIYTKKIKSKNFGIFLTQVIARVAYDSKNMQWLFIDETQTVFFNGDCVFSGNYEQTFL